jgi:hypothetical protein
VSATLDAPATTFSLNGYGRLGIDVQQCAALELQVEGFLVEGAMAVEPKRLGAGAAAAFLGPRRCRES